MLTVDLPRTTKLFFRNKISTRTKKYDNLDHFQTQMSNLPLNFSSVMVLITSFKNWSAILFGLFHAGFLITVLPFKDDDHSVRQLFWNNWILAELLIAAWKMYIKAHSLAKSEVKSTIDYSWPATRLSILKMVTNITEPRCWKSPWLSILKSLGVFVWKQSLVIFSQRKTINFSPLNYFLSSFSQKSSWPSKKTSFAQSEQNLRQIFSSSIPRS